MDLQLIIALNVMALSLLAAVLPLIQRMPHIEAWIAVNLAVIVGGGLALLFAPAWAGAIAAGLFVPLVAVPAVLGHRANRHALQGRMQAAADCARWAVLFHPTPRARFYAATLAAQAHDSNEDKSAALQALARGATAEQKVTLQIIDLRHRSEWPRIVALLRDNPGTARLMPSMMVRALGESGRLDDMMQTYEISRPHMVDCDLAACHLFVMAFCGRPAAVEALFDQALAVLDDDGKTYWRAIAARSSGSADETWRTTLETLSRSASLAGVRTAAARQLAQISAGPPALEPASTAILQRVETRLAQQAAVQRPRQPSPAADTAPATSTVVATVRRWQPATFGLLAVIGCVYLVEEARGGSQNLRALIDLGAMWPQFVLQRGEWWRLGTALFLHFGLLHVALNGLMLFLLGRAFERRFGSLRLLLVFVLGGLASSAFVLWTMWSGYARPAVLVGASGAIFAVFGCEVAWQLVNWLRTRDASDARGLVSAAIVLAIQVAFDLSIPEVSLAAHASGLVAGFALGLAFAIRSRRA